MNTSSKKTILNVFPSILTIFLLFIVWIIVSEIKNNQLIFPTIDQIFSEFINLFKFNNLKILGASILRLFTSIVLSFGIGILIIILYVLKRGSYAFFSPMIKIMRSVPFVSFSIFVLLIFGNRFSPYIITILVVVPIVVDGLKSSVDRIDRNLTDDLALLNLSFFRKIVQFYIPILFPSLLTLFLQTFGLGFKVMVMGEYLSQSPLSVGKELYNAKSFLDMDVLLAWTILIVIIVGIVELLVNILKNKHNKKTI